jgi:hypothetical protein
MSLHLFPHITPAWLETHRECARRSTGPLTVRGKGPLHTSCAVPGNALNGRQRTVGVAGAQGLVPLLRELKMPVHSEITWVATLGEPERSLERAENKGYPQNHNVLKLTTH